MARFPAVAAANARVRYGSRAVGRPGGSMDKRRVRQIQAGRELAREYGPEAVRTMAAIMRGQVGTPQNPATVADRLKACNSILDRAYGKPAETVEVSVMQAMDIVYRDPEDILKEIKRRQLQPVLELAAHSVDESGDDDSASAPA